MSSKSYAELVEENEALKNQNLLLRNCTIANDEQPSKVYNETSLQNLLVKKLTGSELVELAKYRYKDLLHLRLYIYFDYVM